VGVGVVTVGLRSRDLWTYELGGMRPCVLWAPPPQAVLECTAAGLHASGRLLATCCTWLLTNRTPECRGPGRGHLLRGAHETLSSA
jgi:hypothetical protein